MITGYVAIVTIQSAQARPQYAMNHALVIIQITRRATVSIFTASHECCGMCSPCTQHYDFGIP